MSTPSPTPIEPRPLLVACLCARWCNVCGDYEAPFAQAIARFGAQVQPRWLDIEDEAALLDGVDVENFPTLLIARDDALLFFGTVTPHVQTLSRLVASALAGDLRRIDTEPPATALARRLIGKSLRAPRR